MSEIGLVDLSAKVEQWSKDTAVAFSNGSDGSILVSKKVKKQARDWLKIRYPTQQQAFYQYLLFATFVYLLIRPYLSQFRQLIIDFDYSGAYSQRRIKDFLLDMVRRDKPGLRSSFITFQAVRGSTADQLARNIFRRHKQADRKISLKEIQAVFSP